MWSGRELASVAGASPPKGSPFLSPQNWMSQGSLRGITCLLIPTPLTWGLGKAGRKWSAWRGLILSLPSSSGSLNQYASSCPFVPGGGWGPSQCPISAASPLLPVFSLLHRSMPQMPQHPFLVHLGDAFGTLFISCLPQAGARTHVRLQSSLYFTVFPVCLNRRK